MSAITVSQKFIDSLRAENRPGNNLLVDRAGNKWIAGEGTVFPLGPHPVITGEYAYVESGLSGRLENALVVHIPTMTVVLSEFPDTKNNIFVVNRKHYFNGATFHVPLDGPVAGNRLEGRITVYLNTADVYLTRSYFITRLYKDGRVIHDWKCDEKHVPYFVGSNAIIFNGTIHEFE